MLMSVVVVGLTLLFLFVCFPMWAVGLRLATTRSATRVRVLGGVIALVGSSPFLLWISFLYWALFHSN